MKHSPVFIIGSYPRIANNNSASKCIFKSRLRYTEMGRSQIEVERQKFILDILKNWPYLSIWGFEYELDLGTFEFGAKLDPELVVAAGRQRSRGQF